MLRRILRRDGDTEWLRGEMATAEGVANEGLSEEVSFGQRKRAGCVNIQRKNIPRLRTGLRTWHAWELLLYRSLGSEWGHGKRWHSERRWGPHKRTL